MNLPIFPGLKGTRKCIRTLEWKRDAILVPPKSVVKPIFDRDNLQFIRYFCTGNNTKRRFNSKLFYNSDIEFLDSLT